MEFKIKGPRVDIDVLETSDGQGWVFSRGIFFTVELKPGEKQRLVDGKPKFYKTLEQMMRFL